MIPAVAILSVLLVLAAAWRWTPLGDLLDIPALIERARELSNHAGAPFYMLAIYVIGGFIAVPVTLMIIVIILAFGPWLGFGIGRDGRCDRERILRVIRELNADVLALQEAHDRHTFRVLKFPLAFPARGKDDYQVNVWVPSLKSAAPVSSGLPT